MRRWLLQAGATGLGSFAAASPSPWTRCYASTRQSQDGAANRSLSLTWQQAEKVEGRPRRVEVAGSAAK